MKTDQIGFQTNGQFPTVNWAVFEILLGLLQEFWIEELELQTIDNWYQSYTRFLAALKNRVTIWKHRDKYRPSLRHHILDMGKEVRKVWNKYYRKRYTIRGVVTMKNLE